MTKGKAPRERPWVAAGFLLALVIVAALGWLSRQSDRRLQTSETWVAHTQEVLDALESVRSAMLEAQNQGLGYAVTDNGLHAEACGTALSQWSGHLQRLRDLTADNPVQQDRMGRLEALLSQRRLVIERAIARHRKGGDGEAGGQAATLLLDLASPREPAAMLDDMRAEEQRLLKGREAKLLAVQRLATWTQAGGTAVTVALLIALFALSRRENARLHRAEESVLKNEARFRAMVEGMTDYAIIMLDTGGAVVSWNAGSRNGRGSWWPPGTRHRRPTAPRASSWPTSAMRCARP